jgi:hypothetical protein
MGTIFIQTERLQVDWFSRQFECDVPLTKSGRNIYFA